MKISAEPGRHEVPCGTARNSAPIPEEFSVIRTFEIYVNNRCNLNCRYCYVAVNRGPAMRLTPGQLYRGLGQVRKLLGGRLPHVRIFGGEPLLDYPAVIEAVRRIRAGDMRGASIELCTNGTLLDRKRVEELLGLGVALWVSLDGIREETDRNRVYSGKRGLSVFDSVLGNLEDVPKELRRRIAVNFTITPGMVGHLAESAAQILRRGFSWVRAHLDYHAQWTPEDLEVLRKQIGEVVHLTRETVASGRPPGRFMFLPELVEALDKAAASGGRLAAGINGRELYCDKIVLGPDGKYYPCFVSMGSAPGSGLSPSVGSLEAGYNWGQRKKLHREAMERARRMTEFEGYSRCPCPRDIFLPGRKSGGAPAAILENRRKVFGIMMEGAWELLQPLRHNLAFRETINLPGSHKCLPRLTVSAEVLCGTGWKNLARALYLVMTSAGIRKECSVTGPLPPGCARRLQAARLYALTLAHEYGKSLSWSVENASPALQGKLAGIWGESGTVFQVREDALAGTRRLRGQVSRWGAGRTRAVLGISRSSAGSIEAKLRRFWKLGVRRFALEADDSFLKSAGSVDLGAMLGRVSCFLIERASLGEFGHLENFWTAVRRSEGESESCGSLSLSKDGGLAVRPLSAGPGAAGSPVLDARGDLRQEWLDTRATAAVRPEYWNKAARVMDDAAKKWLREVSLAARREPRFVAYLSEVLVWSKEGCCGNSSVQL